jgi:hypothetical protein
MKQSTTKLRASYWGVVVWCVLLNFIWELAPFFGKGDYARATDISFYQVMISAIIYFFVLNRLKLNE